MFSWNTMNVEGTQQERKVQHYRMQKERRVRMEKHYGRRWNAAGTQEGTQMERRVQTASNYKKHYGRKGDAAGAQGRFMLHDEVKLKDNRTQKLKSVGKVNEI